VTTGIAQEILTDNGSQYVAWRGKSAFVKELEKRGIQHLVATPRRPQTSGKIERFWGALWRECIQNAQFVDLGDARQRIGLFIDHYDFQRPHQQIDGLVPADHLCGAASEVSLPEPVCPQGIPTVNMDLVNEQPRSRAPRHWMKG
jgi:putative transposase